MKLQCCNNFCWFQGDIDLCGGDPNDGIDSDCSASSNPGKQVLVGICAMAKKAQSKPMTEILTRLREFDYIHMTVFEEEVILKVKNSLKKAFLQSNRTKAWNTNCVYFFCRIRLRIGQFVIAWYRSIRKVFHLKRPFNMHNCVSHTLSITYTCNSTFKIVEKSTRFFKELALKYHDMRCLIVIHPIQRVCTLNV